MRLPSGYLCEAFDPNDLGIKDLSEEQDLSLKLANDTSHWEPFRAATIGRCLTGWGANVRYAAFGDGRAEAWMV